jgi:hypothetical protein
VAARWQERKSAFHLLRDRLTVSTQQRTQTKVEAELVSVMTDEVEHSACGLAGVLAQATTELLQEQGAALGGSQ